MLLSVILTYFPRYHDSCPHPPIVLAQCVHHPSMPLLSKSLEL